MGIYPTMKTVSYIALVLFFIAVYAEFSGSFAEASGCYSCVKDCHKGCQTSVHKNQFHASKNVSLCKGLGWERCNCSKDEAQYRDSNALGVFPGNAWHP